jgi:exodeoxyribonuclease-3
LKKLASWNVNGIRAVSRKGYLDWLTKESPDIVSLQETKASPEQFPLEITSQNTYKIFSASAIKKGYSGVLVGSKCDPKKVFCELGEKKFDNEGRTVICEYDSFFLINGYFPNGSRDHSRVSYKLEYSEYVLQYAKKLEKKKPVIICGDLNTAHHEIDLKNPKTNKKTTGFLPNERAWVDRLVEHGFVDIFRHLNNEPDHYSWWSYRNNCRERNIGWRIDYFFLSESLVNKVNACYYQPEVLGSDHCPMILEIDL